jgi:hypothetical protein
MSHPDPNDDDHSPLCFSLLWQRGVGEAAGTVTDNLKEMAQAQRESISHQHSVCNSRVAR